MIANRGEIAVRIVRACRDLDISPVAVYSEADRDALHVKLADEAYPIGPAPAAESYLVADKILDAARKSGAEALHPGYGFLAENEGFARACRASDVTFIGPSPEAIRLMGSKVASRTAMVEAGVPVIPGSSSLEDPEEALSFCREIGYPVMIKASAGGGGIGMRAVHDEADLIPAFEQARSQARDFFNDGTVFVEKCLQRPRHIEIQILGDRHGHRIHLGERECSIQRRHQKVVEECPSPLVDEDFRRRLGETALKAARAVDYFSAGTVEMLVDAREDGREFYFLEMNTRLQVEHPVTEIVTGVDLVQEQIRIANGEPLSMRQEDVAMTGWAIECRVYAEDPDNSFLPSPGQILELFEPSGPGIRNDSGVYSGFRVPVHYDPLISKLIAFGRDRSQAVRRMRRALSEYRIAGVRTNMPFLETLLAHPAFQSGELSTDFIDRHGLLQAESSNSDSVPALAAAIERSSRHQAPPRHEAKESGWKLSGRVRR